MISELVSASLAILLRQAPLAGALLAAAAAAVYADAALGRRLPPRAARVVHGALLAAAVALGLYLAWSILFLCDDAFISFRYARNLVRGEGLVWNPGEWVEGYTNFLWTAVLAAAGLAGASIPHAAMVGDLAAMAVALIAATAAVRRVAPAPVLVPFAALALAGTRAFYTFGSSGLETMPVAALVAVAIWASTTRRGPLGAGMAMTAAVLARPDQLLLAACFAAAFAVEDLVHGEGPLLRRLVPRRYLSYAAPFLLVYLPYFLVRWYVYGDLFPNTYYARSAHLAYWRQGIFYGVHFVMTTGALVWLPVFLVATAGPVADRNDTRLRVLAVLGLPLFAEYVMRVGGDFMEHRFFVPVLPLAAITLEASLRRRLAASTGRAARLGVGAAAAASLAAALVPVELFGPFEKRWHLAAEPSFYRVSSVFPLHVDSPYWDDGQKLRAALTDRGLRLPIASDSIGILGWVTDLPMVDAFGLTNRTIARKPVGRRGRPGHEKYGTPEELVQLGAVADYGDPWGEAWRPMTRVLVDGAPLYLLRWDAEWMARIAQLPEVRLPDPAAEARRLAAHAPRDRVLEAAAFLDVLAGTQVPAATAALRERLGEVADFEGGPPAGARATGGLRVSTARVPGSSGKGLLTSLPDTAGGTGSMEIPVESLDGEELRFALGGTSRLASVRLVVDGVELHRASPRGALALEPVIFPLSPEVRGRPATLIVEDPDPERGRGLLVDAVHLAPRAGDVRERLRGVLPRRTALVALLHEAERVLPPGDPDLARLLERIALRFTLDELPRGSRIEGDAFGAGPVPGPLESQSTVSGIQGTAFLNSFHGRDGTTGRVELPWFVLPREPIAVLVGGGADCEHTYVGLEVAGRIVSRACGREDEVLRPELLPTRGNAGKRGRVVIVDQDPGPWGHVLADDVIVPRGAEISVEQTSQ